jgi:uncharacterized protein (TIGR03435 family)
MRMVSVMVSVCLGAMGYAQAPAFEVASIKAHPGPITFSKGPLVSGASLTGTAITLLDLIADAYGLRYDQVSGGPNWLGSDHFDIVAKSAGEGPLARNQAMQMLQGLLADRFQLKAHREMKETAVYALVVGKNGSKLKESAPDEAGGFSVRGNGIEMQMQASKGTMDKLAYQLSLTAGRPVLDRTGLSGHYTYKLDWLPANAAAPPDSDVPSIFTAVQEQLGLRLEATRAPIEILVIDRAERPSEN